jgi:hypothetical protein
MNQDDEVVREVRAAREQYCQQFGYDLAAIVRDLRERERTGGRRVVNLPHRRPTQAPRPAAGAPTDPAPRDPEVHASLTPPSASA